MSDARVRPELHFTAAHGWTNDPYGIHAGHGGYEMFFQYNPAGTEWSEKAQWGHAASDDLITWRELDVALTPLSDEIGCWSGSAVVDLDGSVAVYTRIADEDWGRGAVALARPTLGSVATGRESRRVRCSTARPTTSTSLPFATLSCADEVMPGWL